MLPNALGDATTKVRLNADGTRSVVANVQDNNAGYRGLTADGRGQNLYWLKKQRPELWHAQAAARHAHNVQTGLSAPSAPNKITVPGFQDFCPGWLMKPTTEEFIETSTMQRYAYDKGSSKYYPLQQAVDRDQELSVHAEGSTSSESNDAPPCRKVLIADLHRAASVLNFDISHHHRPAAVFAVFDTNGASSVIEAAAKTFHTYLLPMLATQRGEWSPVDHKAALTMSLHQSLGAVEDPSVASSVSAAAALLLGSRLTTIAFGPGARCVVSAALQDPLPGPPVLSVHSSGPGQQIIMAARDLIRGPFSSGSAGPSRPLLSPALPSALILAVSEAKGARDAPGSLARVAEAARQSQQFGSVTGCYDLDFGGQFQCLTLIANAAGSLTGLLDTDVAPITEEAVANRRPRAGCRMLLNAARAKNAKASMVAAMVNFVWSASPEPAPPASKRPKTEAQDKTKSKVRVRHILLRHAACAVPQDPVRHQKVTRSLEEAEVQLLAVLQELDRDPTQFNTKCREISECETSLKGGDFAGDLGWLSREKPQTTAASAPEVHKVAFSLALGQMSDLVASKIGLHIVMRTA